MRNFKLTYPGVLLVMLHALIYKVVSYSSVISTLRYFFASEFDDAELGGIVQDLGLKKIELTNEDNRLKRAKLNVEIKTLEDKLNSHIKPKTVTSQVLDMYKDFDTLVFNMANGEPDKVNEFKKMSIFDFYRHKELLIERSRNERNKNST